MRTCSNTRSLPIVEAHTDAIVNVASVPQRSPFRYPGGKTWLVPRLRRWLCSLSFRPVVFVEPFAGGGISGLTVAFENLAHNVVLAELDESVAAVWQTILGDKSEWLANQILHFDLTPDTVRCVLAETGHTMEEVAFQTILRNRTQHGGILAPGSGRLKQGENGKGLASRWYPRTLYNRLKDIEQIKEKVEFLHRDAFEVIRQHAENPHAVFLLDPPYTADGKRAGSRLYKYHALNHEALFELVTRIQGSFLMTYDNNVAVHNLAERHGFATSAVSMKNTHHAEMTELLISRNLDWI